ncbi:MAG: dehydratase [Rhodoferax sp.]|nr:dehydratase [Rhodoferax sp.]
MSELSVETLIPHRGAMRLIDRIVRLDGDDAVAETDVAIDGIFATDGRVPAWAGIEYMAQTVAAWSGARSRLAGGPPRLGLLLGSRRYIAHCAGFTCGVTLRIETRCELIGANGLGLFACRILRGDEPLAEATISVFEPDDAMAFLAGESA